MVDFTVAICTYNGATRLPHVLERLRSQLNTDTFSWEVIIVDNNSHDPTAAVVQQYQRHWPQRCPLHYYFESTQGLAFARRCAVLHAQGAIIGFLDDDNLPAPTWVAAAYQFGQQHPQAGAYGSRIKGVYEIPPPANFHRIACYLAICDRGSTPQPYPRHRWIFPAGAGMVVRKQAWVASVPATPRLKGVCGTSLKWKGEDVETLSYIRKAGWEIWYNPAMQIEHWIPGDRLTPNYLTNLMQGVGLSRYPIRMIRFPIWVQPLVLPLFWVKDLGKLLLHLLRSIQPYGKSQVSKTTDYERVLLIHSVISPFYHGWHRSLEVLRWVSRLSPVR